MTEQRGRNLHGSVDGVIDAVAEIARERTKILESMKEALLRGDDDEALERARELTGLPRKAANSR
jgi:hypothetical protein